MPIVVLGNKIDLQVPCSCCRYARHTSTFFAHPCIPPTQGATQESEFKSIMGLFSTTGKVTPEFP